MKYKIKPLDIVLVVLILVLGAYKLKTSLVPMHVKLLSKDDGVRNNALSKLNTMSLAKKPDLVVKISKQMIDSDAQGRRFGLYALRKIELSSPEVLNAYVLGLSDKDAEVRNEAGLALLETGEPGMKMLIQTFRSGEAVAEHEAGQLIEKMGKSTVPKLIPLLFEDDNTAIKTVGLLKNIGPWSDEAAPFLEKIFTAKEKNKDLRIQSALAFNIIIPTATQTLPTYSEVLKENGWNPVHWEIVKAIEAMGRFGKPMADVLTTKMNQANENMGATSVGRPRLAAVLNTIDPRRSELIDLGFDLKQKALAIRYRAVYFLSEMTPPPVGAMEMLVGAMNDSSPYVAARALYAMSRVGFNNAQRIKTIFYPRIVRVLGVAEKTKGLSGLIESIEPEIKKIQNDLIPYVNDGVKKGVLSKQLADKIAQ